MILTLLCLLIIETLNNLYLIQKCANINVHSYNIKVLVSQNLHDKTQFTVEYQKTPIHEVYYMVLKEIIFRIPNAIKLVWYDPMIILQSRQFICDTANKYSNTIAIDGYHHTE